MYDIGTEFIDRPVQPVAAALVDQGQILNFGRPVALLGGGFAGRGRSLPQRVVDHEPAEFMEQFLVLCRRRRPQVVKTIGAVVIAQRLTSVYAVFFGTFHILAESFFVNLGVLLPLEDVLVEFEFHRQVVRLDVGEIARQRPYALVVPIVVGLHIGVVDAHLLPFGVACGTVVGYPAETLVDRMQVFRNLGDDFFRLFQFVAVAVARRHDLFGDGVEPRQFDILVISFVEAPAHLVDIPFAGRNAVGALGEIHPPPAERTPVGRRLVRVVVLPVDDRVGHYHDDLALGRGCAQPL